MKKYTLLINEVFDAVKPLLPKINKSPYTVFAEGPYKVEETTSQEYTILRSELANYYVNVIHKNFETLKINKDDYKVQASAQYTYRYKHSCYPRNVRRWMNGTISRKKKCRVEFCTLLYCWAFGWASETSSDHTHQFCQEQIKNICRRYISAGPDASLFELLWTAMESTYHSGE